MDRCHITIQKPRGVEARVIVLLTAPAKEHKQAPCNICLNDAAYSKAMRRLYEEILAAQ